jgi:hypothetical protein
LWNLWKLATHNVLLNTINDTMDDFFNDVSMISVRFVVSKAHHTPMGYTGVPSYLNGAIIDLFTCQFHSGNRKRSVSWNRHTLLIVRQRAPGKGQGLLFPFIIFDIHLVVWFVIRTAAPDMQQKHGFGEEIGFVWFRGNWREAEDEFEVD